MGDIPACVTDKVDLNGYIGMELMSAEALTQGVEQTVARGPCQTRMCTPLDPAGHCAARQAARTIIALKTPLQAVWVS